MIGTLVGATAIVVLTACFPQDRSVFLVGLALWGAACTLVATLLRNFAAYAAALAGYTAAIIASDQLGATGGPNGQAFMLAVTRVSEISIGIVCAGMVLAGTDFGTARRRLAGILAAVSAEIAGRFTRTLAQAGSDLSYTQPVRRELYRRVIALDPTIDEAKGNPRKSGITRRYCRRLWTVCFPLWPAGARWRCTSRDRPTTRLGRRRMSSCSTFHRRCGRHWARASRHAGWPPDPIRLHRLCEAGIRVLIDLPAGTPSLRLLADQTAKVLGGVSDALEGLALLVADPTRVRSRGRSYRLHVPDWLPALVNAGRTFVAIEAMEVFWIVTAWPNGALAITFTAICVVLFAPRADQAYQVAMSFMVGTALAAVLAAIIAFAVLPMVRPLKASVSSWAFSRAGRCSIGAALAGSDICSHGWQLCPAPRARKRDELRHAPVLHLRARDRRRLRRCGAFVSVAAAPLPGAADAPAPGLEPARPTTRRDRFCPADTR